MRIVVALILLALSLQCRSDTIYKVVIMPMSESALMEICAARTGMAGKCVIWDDKQRACLLLVDSEKNLTKTRFFVDAMVYCSRLASK